MNYNQCLNKMIKNEREEYMDSAYRKSGNRTFHSPDGKTFYRNAYGEWVRVFKMDRRDY